MSKLPQVALTLIKPIVYLPNYADCVVIIMFCIIFMNKHIYLKC